MDDEKDVPLSLKTVPPNPSFRSSSPSSSLPPLPIIVVHPSASPPDGHLSEFVTVAAAAPHQQILTLALPIQESPLSASAGGGGGREDYWSDGATSSLIDAWGERFLDDNRGSLRQKQWQEVAEVVNSREDYTKTPRTEAQCKNRIDTLKKKYKIEKAKIVAASNSATSSWPFFHRLDSLLGSPSVAVAARSQFPQKQRTHLPVKRKAPLLPAASLSSTSDSFPPEAQPAPSANGRLRGLPARSMKELARAILKFGEVYQRVECSKLQQDLEMEQQRMGFASELEVQRLQFLMKTQMEFFKLKLRRSSASAGRCGGSSSNRRHSRRRHHQAPRSNNGEEKSE
ncbi:hypothetical protein HPP92_002373 [Vanilla planifolia]|uniref:Myb/SANT-like DNA-binding domain-containing protein n=1 Tax=Vanilla planifolia TaxID=51239 RepID=A0A835S582_VANPL|nr:hypothetical protein HPP92_002373 [Vanilla planifolia]